MRKWSVRRFQGLALWQVEIHLNPWRTFLCRGLPMWTWPKGFLVQADESPVSALVQNQLSHHAAEWRCPRRGIIAWLGAECRNGQRGGLRWAKDPLWYNGPVGLLTTHSPMPGFSKHVAVQFTDYRSHPRHPESSPSQEEPANLCNQWILQGDS